MDGSRTYLITIWGLVQGVGFRPFLYRLAHDLGLKGWVNNTNENVQVAVNADRETLEEFIRLLRMQAPPASRIELIEQREVEPVDFTEFRIIESSSLSDAVTEVSPDIAVCRDCLEDMKRQPNRIDYPFLNCTNCGPRFTIIRDLPYDRSRTTMQEFRMCPSCRAEYENVLDRRFHAQPVACRDCGPRYTLVEMGPGGKDAGAKEVSRAGNESDLSGNKTGPDGDRAIVARTARLIDGGKIVGIKGLGGFFMACDARNEKAVRRLRDSKLREGKPFAVMFRDPEAIQQYCHISPEELAELNSWRKPIVILRNLGRSGSGGSPLAPSVSNGFPTTGAMLPYMPFHYLLFEKLKTHVIVLTSGNLAEEPILIDNQQAELVLGPASDAVLHYNRDIHNRCDDSVLMVVNKEPRLIRRSRGYVPNPIRLGLETEGIFAAGAELVNCFALGKGRQGIMSQHIGDLKNFETYEFYRETYRRFIRLFRLKPVLVAHDMHPDYLSTRFAEELKLPALSVQHHHAHIASVLAEHGLEGKVIGVSFDGTGLGEDGNIWGSEFLVCDLEGYERISHLEYMAMPGGDRVTQEPWRMALSCLYSVFGEDLQNRQLPFLEGIEPVSLDGVMQSIRKNIHCPLSSGAGRLFDAVAALLNICTESRFHAEAPMRLEAAIHSGEEGNYPFKLPEHKETGSSSIATGPVIENIVRDIERGEDPGRISARFHNTMSAIILGTVTRIARERGIRQVALSGGTFQNRYLSGRVETRLKEAGFDVMIPLQLPANDGGIALGQLAVAAKKRSLGLI